MLKKTLLPGFLTLISSVPAFAGYTVYTDRTAFEAAVADPLTTEDFNAFTTDQSFQVADGPKTAGPLTFAETGPSTAGTGNGKPNQIDATPFEISGIFSGDGSSYVYLSASSDDNPAAVYGVDLTFSSVATAFGGDFTHFISTASGATHEDFRLTLLGAASVASYVLPRPASSGTTFFGVVADPGDTFTGIAFAGDVPVASRRATVGLDNVAVALVPEPASLALLGFASLALASRRRR